MWVPGNILGPLRQIVKNHLQERLTEVNAWHEEGGVLIIGYEIFRDMILNQATVKRARPLDDEQHEQVKRQLLAGPNIVIADEAHKMKNLDSKIAKATAQFHTKSRIALTGSPLANSLEEYFSMINWVANNYLGPLVEFRAKYVEPVQVGLYTDSTASERRTGLKRLEALKENLAPKVNRADISVLRGDLPQKVEFVITVPLTQLQRKAYVMYVDAMTSIPTGKDFKQTTLWHWLAILSLLCNHPQCFADKLTEREADANKVREEVTAGIEDTVIPPVYKVGVSQALVGQEAALFATVPNLESAEHSNKAKILVDILDASKAVNDKVLIFSSSIPSLNYLERLCRQTGRRYLRLDGGTNMSKRQGMTKRFNHDDTEVALISTTAGGLGLNLFGANRVIIFDFKFNPVAEQQAVGRAYRIGQKKPVFVYRFIAGGTFENIIHNSVVFKAQLALRAVDKKNPLAWAKKKAGDFLFHPKDVEQQSLEKVRGLDPQVLDKVLENNGSIVKGIETSDTFEQHDNDSLTLEEKEEVEREVSDLALKRSNPQAYSELLQRRFEDEVKSRRAVVTQHVAPAMVSIVNRHLQAMEGPSILPSLPPNSGAIALDKAQTLTLRSGASTSHLHSVGVMEKATPRGPVLSSGTRVAAPEEDDNQHAAAVKNGRSHPSVTTPGPSQALSTEPHTSAVRAADVRVASGLFDGSLNGLSKKPRSTTLPKDETSKIASSELRKEALKRLRGAIQTAFSAEVKRMKEPYRGVPGDDARQMKNICGEIIIEALDMSSNIWQFNKVIETALERFKNHPRISRALLGSQTSAHVFVAQIHRELPEEDSPTLANRRISNKDGSDDPPSPAKVGTSTAPSSLGFFRRALDGLGSLLQN